MILPDKYVPYNKTNIYYSDLILKVLSTIKKRKTIELLWNKFHKEYELVSFNNFYNSVLLLIMFGLLEVNEGGELYEVKKTRNF